MMLRFRGSDYRRFSASTCYDGIDNFLTSLGFTNGKENYNLYYKVEEGNPVILLLYVDDLFVTGEDGLIVNTKTEACYRVQDEILGYDALFYRHGGVEKCKWNIPRTREVCSRDPEEV